MSVRWHEPEILLRVSRIRAAEWDPESAARNEVEKLPQSRSLFGVKNGPWPGPPPTSGFEGRHAKAYARKGRPKRRPDPLIAPHGVRGCNPFNSNYFTVERKLYLNRPFDQPQKNKKR